MLGIAPQAWGYFSSPRSEAVEVFRWKGGEWRRIDAPLASPVNLFGLRRTTPNHGAEFRNVMEQVGDRWSLAALSREQLPDSPGDALAVRDLARHPQLCGEVLLVARPPIPWAWARTGSSLATKYVRLSVQC